VRARVVEGGSLTYVRVEPDGFDAARTYPVVVLLHGFGANMYDLTGLCPALDDENYVYLLPNAPYAVDFGGGAVGYSWSRRPLGGGPPLPGETTADALLDPFFAEVLPDGARNGRAVLLGFSQGGGLALRYGLPRPEAFAGIAVLSGAFRSSQEVEERLPANRDQHVFLAHGLFDPLVDVQRGRDTRGFLESHGYRPEYHEYEMAHEVSEEVLYDLAPWLARVLPPGT
jgi:phospholipase/carboxylesterase